MLTHGICRILVQKMRFLVRFTKRLSLEVQILSATFLLIIVFGLMTYKSRFPADEHQELHVDYNWISSHQYVNYTEGAHPNHYSCYLPTFPPFHKSVIQLLKQMQPTVCGVDEQWTYLDRHGMLCLNFEEDPSLFDKLMERKCYYSEAIRKGDHFALSTSKPFDHDLDVSHADVIRVQCFTLGMYQSYQNLHLNFRSVPLYDSGAHHINEKYNVLLFGIERLSRLNAMRQLPKTYKFLEDHLNALAFIGYHQVDKSSVDNVLALLTGLLPSIHSRKLLHFEDPQEPFDNLPFIWKNYSKAGYRTLLAENDPDLSVFNYKGKRFRDQPTDHYTRTFWQVAADVLGKHSNPQDCIRNCANHQLHIEHVQNFIERMDGYDPFLAFSFIQGFADVNQIGIADEDFLFFLKDLYESGNLDNTFLLFFGSRGLTYRDIADTPAGHVEETMPLFTVYVPDHFKERRPRAYQNMKANTFKLTSTFDAYCTLVDILNFSLNNSIDIGNFKTPEGSSLFGEVPESRTCTDAGIRSVYCNCI